MKKYVKSDKYLAVMSCSLFVFSAAGIVALCLWNNPAKVGVLTISQLLGIVSAVAFIAYISALCVIAAKKKGARKYLELSAEVLLASVILIGLSPVALVVWIIETVCEKISEKRAER